MIIPQLHTGVHNENLTHNDIMKGKSMNKACIVQFHCV